MLKPNNRLQDAEEYEEDSLVDQVEEETQAEGFYQDEPSTYFDRDSKSFFASLITHVLLIVGLAAIPVIHELSKPALVIRSIPVEEEQPEFELDSEVVFSDDPNEQVGSNSIGQSDVALSSAPILAEMSEIVTPQLTPSLIANLDLAIDVQEAVALTESTSVVRGLTGFGTAGTQGAVDRVTYELIQSIENRPTLVVWLFDASVSLSKRRDEIRDRFDHIYEEIGLVTERKSKSGAKIQEDRLLTSIVSFGQEVSLLTDKPTSDLKVIRGAIDNIQIDSSGVEMVFSAIYMAADRYKGLRIDHGDGPDRNVMLIAVTDERGDDTQGMDKTIDLCRRFAIPVYIMGVPAPFGRDFTYIKYVDPDPKFDQSDQWAQIDQGPETLVAERVKIGYKENFYEEPMIDSGFGPYALSRLSYETGGIFFTIHPSRKYDQDVNRGSIESFSSHLQRFFDPDLMTRYRPDYLSAAEYEAMLRKNPLRASLVQAAQLARTGVLEKPKMRFVKKDEAGFVREVTEAQQEAARLDPGLNMLCQVLAQGETGRKLEISARWLASFDLSVATAQAERIRNETYNQMLGKAKRGMNFEKPKNNTWTLKPDDEISVNSRLEKDAQNARDLFTGIVNQHAGTPWAYLARRELERPIGWKWVESYTDLNPTKPQMNQNANNNNPMPKDEEKRKLEMPPPRRPIPKL